MSEVVQGGPMASAPKKVKSDYCFSNTMYLDDIILTNLSQISELG